MAELVSQFEAQMAAVRQELEQVTAKLTREIEALKHEVAEKQSTIDVSVLYFCTV